MINVVDMAMIEKKTKIEELRARIRILKDEIVQTRLAIRLGEDDGKIKLKYLKIKLFRTRKELRLWNTIDKKNR